MFLFLVLTINRKARTAEFEVNTLQYQTLKESSGSPLESCGNPGDFPYKAEKNFRTTGLSGKEFDIP